MKQILTTLCILLCAVQVQAFNVVIDAGHGGKDPGAVGSTLKEKDLNLEVALAVGKMITNNHTDVKVYYTRSTDKFLSLQERADFVNKHKADLFICIHTNAAEAKSLHGTETYVLGLHKAESNLKVAMRENAVMLLEDDYQTKYQGFIPNSAESYIMFEFLQDEYLDKSLDFAGFVQEQLTAKTTLTNLGVKQAGFWVLSKSACPSVLIEMGFISNKTEEQYLSTAAGKKNIEEAIYNAFVTYYNKISKPSTPPQSTTAPTPEVTTPATTNNANDNLPVFRVQIFSSTKVVAANDATFKGLKDCQYTHTGKLYKYTYGESSNYQEIKKIQQQLKDKFKDCFIVAFLNDKPITIQEALKLIQK